MKKLPALPRYTRDPRLFLGVALIIGGGVTGALILGDGDNTDVLRAVATTPQGDVLNRNNFEIISLPEHLAGSYVRADDFDDESLAVSTIHSGDFLSPHSLSTSTAGVVVVIPLATPLASSITVGSQVDVWRIVSAGYSDDARAEPLATNAVLHGVSQSQSLIEGPLVAEVLVDREDIPRILPILGTQDEFAIVGSELP